MAARANGARGEDYAAACLARHGYRVVARNLRVPPYGELDIIAEKDGVLAFVEVKTRAAGGWSRPAEAVTPQKQRRIIRAAACYLAGYDGAAQPRFDVFEVVTAGSGDFAVLRHQHIEGAFELNETNRLD